MTKDMIAELQHILDESVLSGEECGCQLTVYRHGKLECDLYAGYTDETHSQKIGPETLFPVFSVGKGIVSTLYHIIAERGLVSENDSVGKFWKEYACNGKEGTRVFDFLTHRAGMFRFPENYSLDDWFDWDKACAALASSSPYGPIGGKHTYHAHTYGLLVGRLLEKVTGTELCALLRKEIFDPLNIHTLFFGMPDDRARNLAKITAVDNASPEEKNDHRILFNRHAVLAGKNPSSNGTANAHALARIYGALLEDGVDGVKLLKEETLNHALILRRSEDDPVLKNQWDKFGFGYALCGPEAPWNRMFGHGGACGSEGVGDRKTGYAIGFTKNKLNRTHPCHPTRNAIHRVLGIPESNW